MKEGIIDFVEPNDRGIFKKEIFNITEVEKEELKNEIRRAKKEILDLDFYTKKCNDSGCQYCKLRELV